MKNESQTAHLSLIIKQVRWIAITNLLVVLTTALLAVSPAFAEMRWSPPIQLTWTEAPVDFSIYTYESAQAISGNGDIHAIITRSLARERQADSMGVFYLHMTRTGRRIEYVEVSELRRNYSGIQAVPDSIGNVWFFWCQNYSTQFAMVVSPEGERLFGPEIVPTGGLFNLVGAFFDIENQPWLFYTYAVREDNSFNDVLRKISNNGDLIGDSLFFNVPGPTQILSPIIDRDNIAFIASNIGSGPGEIQIMNAIDLSNMEFLYMDRPWLEIEDRGQHTKAIGLSADSVMFALYTSSRGGFGLSLHLRGFTKFDHDSLFDLELNHEQYAAEHTGRSDHYGNFHVAFERYRLEEEEGDDFTAMRYVTINSIGEFLAEPQELGLIGGRASYDNLNILPVSPDTSYMFFIGYIESGKELHFVYSPYSEDDTLDVRSDDDLLPESDPIQLFPNPSNGRFSLKIEESFDQFERLTLFDLQGREVFKHSGRNLSGQIELPTDLLAGVYFLKLEGQGGERTRKLVLVK